MARRARRRAGQTRSCDRRGQRGIATVWGIAWIVVCLSMGWLALVVAGAVAAQHRLDAAADLAALSGAGRLQRGADACTTADAIAAANAARLESCRIDGADVIVTVSAPLRAPFGLDARISAEARAGPT